MRWRPSAGHLLLQLVAQRGELGEGRTRIDAHRALLARLLGGPRLRPPLGDRLSGRRPAPLDACALRLSCRPCRLAFAVAAAAACRRTCARSVRLPAGRCALRRRAAAALHRPRGRCSAGRIRLGRLLACLAPTALRRGRAPSWRWRGRCSKRPAARTGSAWVLRQGAPALRRRRPTERLGAASADRLGGRRRAYRQRRRPPPAPRFAAAGASATSAVRRRHFARRAHSPTLRRQPALRVGALRLSVSARPRGSATAASAVFGNGRLLRLRSARRRKRSAGASALRAVGMPASARSADACAGFDIGRQLRRLPLASACSSFACRLFGLRLRRSGFRGCLACRLVDRVEPAPSPSAAGFGSAR